MKRILSFLAILGLVLAQACKPEKPVEPTLSVSPNSLSFAAEGGSQTINVSAGQAWTASVTGTGFSISPSSGKGDGTVTVTAKAAASTESVSAIPAAKKAEIIDLYNKYGWYSNIDFTSNPEKVHWHSFLTNYIYRNEVGIYEGGLSYGQGVFRPSESSMMRDNLEYFNAPSRLAIFKRIMELSGEGYSLEKFLEYDEAQHVIKAPKRHTPSKAAVAARHAAKHTAAPRLIK